MEHNQKWTNLLFYTDYCSGQHNLSIFWYIFNLTFQAKVILLFWHKSHSPDFYFFFKQKVTHFREKNPNAVTRTKQIERVILPKHLHLSDCINYIFWTWVLPIRTSHQYVCHHQKCIVDMFIGEFKMHSHESHILN